MPMFQMQHIVVGTKFNHLILECRNAFFPPRYFEIASIDEYLVCEKFRSILPNGLNLMGIVVGGHFFLTKRLFYSGIRHYLLSIGSVVGVCALVATKMLFNISIHECHCNARCIAFDQASCIQYTKYRRAKQMLKSSVE